MVRAGIIGCREVMKSGCVGSEACTNCYRAARNNDGEFKIRGRYGASDCVKTPFD